MSMPPPAPPPGSSDDPDWQRDQSPYGQPNRGASPPPGYGAPPPPGYQPYGQPGYGATQEHPQGTTILVLGILSLVVCGLLGPIAWSMGAKAQREIDSSHITYTNRGNVVAGKICGMIASIMLIVAVLGFAVLIAAAAST